MLTCLLLKVARLTRVWNAGMDHSYAEKSRAPSSRKVRYVCSCMCIICIHTKPISRGDVCGAGGNGRYRFCGRWKCERERVIVGVCRGCRASIVLVYGYMAHQSCGSDCVARRSLGCCVTLWNSKHWWCPVQGYRYKESGLRYGVYRCVRARRKK